MQVPIPRSHPILHPALQGVASALDAAGINSRVLDSSEGRGSNVLDARIAIGLADVPRAGAILEEHRFLALDERTAGDELTFVAYLRPSSQWVLLRVRVVPGGARRARAMQQSARAWLRRLRREGRWAGVFPRRTGMTVAILGPDGCGKSTVVARIKESYYFPVRSIYLGLWQQSGGRGKEPTVPGWSLVSRMLRVWARYLVGQYHRALGRLVLFDRYTFDSLAADKEGQGRVARLYTWILGHSCPGPDLVLVLSAPGEVMYRRKREKSPEELEIERQGYLSLQHRVPHVQVVDAARPEETVLADVIDRIWCRYIGY